MVGAIRTKGKGHFSALEGNRVWFDALHSQQVTIKTKICNRRMDETGGGCPLLKMKNSVRSKWKGERKEERNDGKKNNQF